ncbi:hypothetical protein BCV69DRAFT_285367 [Microstroma glucosiphilum]|uniref:Transcription factor CBF/NF-Y/archaeal histone domain-containing protein n=1 Tax=Pseudomicrostroma glucosiphilum TaxID=1684307 RepID=A0A316TXC8_9BASI|nr:hypothetical protein BCV69DRAFT_285367 [Pseudomicrostroma glucosiphilum]PWN18066.1 hypothetical protein BCV69DRAFT_285367 [Pseudomicrostroma glucosiphilum]
MSVPVAALTGGAGGSELDAPGTTPPPQSVTAPLDDTAGGGGGVAGDRGRPSGGSAPIPFPGEEAVEDELVGSGSEALIEDGENDAAEGSASMSLSRGGGAATTRGGSGRGRGRGRGGGRGGNNVAQAKAARAVTAGKKAANLPGTSQLPTARVKKIIMTDPDVAGCGKEATFVIGKACELYIHHLVDEAYTQARLSQRKAVYYKDIAQAVKTNTHLDFLCDVMPQTIPLSVALAERQRHSEYEAALDTGSLVASQGPVGNNGNVAENASLAGAEAEDSIAGTGFDSDAERVRTHSQLTAGGKKVNKKSRNIRANKHAAKGGTLGAAEELAGSSDVEEADVVRGVEEEDEEDAERDLLRAAADDADSNDEGNEHSTAMELDR